MKRYIKPETETIEVGTESLMTNSQNDFGMNDSRPSADDSEENMFAKGHSFSLWDDEDEE